MLEPVLEVAHLGIEDLVVVVLFKLNDLFFQLRLIMDDIGKFLLEFLAHFSKLIEVYLQIEDARDVTYGRLDATRIIALHVSGDLGDDIEHIYALSGRTRGHIGR